MRLCEFNTSSYKDELGIHLFAWAEHKRGDIPTTVEITYISNRVLAKYPKAELVGMRRRFVPTSASREPNKVRWEFSWTVYNKDWHKDI